MPTFFHHTTPHVMRFDYLKDWLEKRHITEVECLVPDISGVARGKIIPASKFCKEEGMRLPEIIFIQTITGDYPEDESAVDPAEIDMVLQPDPSTIRLVPWATEATAQVIHDCFYRDGREVDLAPRTVLRRVLKHYDEQGWKPIIAPELEFFLVKKNIDPDYSLEPPIGRSGRPERARQAYGIDAVNEFDPLFEEIYDFCEAQELNIDTLIHEAGAAQMEINFLHGDPLELADQVFLFKRTVREAAMRHDIYATFMAKPMEKEAGSAMHIHQSLIDKETGVNLFSNDKPELTDLFLSHIAGLQTYLPYAMSFLAPNVNSYRRIARYNSAPINVQWGYDNRTVGLRVPYSDPKSRRVENRVAGADTNPYIVFAASLACGYLGMMQQLQPRPAVEGSAYDLPYELPRNLEEALRFLSEPESLPLCELLGERFVKAYRAIKFKEYETFLAVISSWERDFLLLNV
ncbi:glutamine synthetase [Beggiatoa alba B18LD]|uniref:Glutamine synthetase n=1 Tax=Beggiatoa alba B18LD TaxID=395493 RepID=I3CJN4_9GAMM|nr:glutamine synthetase family protein [Beggiatoa alba]EIJ43827.1 glutamine synthetase [Beggiatoa alba B18LD]